MRNGHIVRSVARSSAVSSFIETQEKCITVKGSASRRAADAIKGVEKHLRFRGRPLKCSRCIALDAGQREFGIKQRPIPAAPERTIGAGQRTEEIESERFADDNVQSRCRCIHCFASWSGGRFRRLFALGNEGKIKGSPRFL